MFHDYKKTEQKTGFWLYSASLIAFPTGVIPLKEWMSQKIDFTTLSGNYSTTEVDTGFTWANGKTIYKKTIEFGALPKSTRKTVPHGISNLDYVVKIESDAMVHSGGDGNCIPLPFPSTDSSANSVEITVNNTNVIVTTRIDFWGDNYDTCYATIYYTKTS